MARRTARLRSRAYDIGGGDTLDLILRRASDSYNFELTGNVENRGGAIFGQWTEASRNAAGAIEGRAAGAHIETAARLPCPATARRRRFATHDLCSNGRKRRIY